MALHPLIDLPGSLLSQQFDLTELCEAIARLEKESEG